jgi:hypothetical protein
MKKQSRRARSSSLPPVRHQLEHAVPTVIHDPEEEMTALGRLTTHAIKEPKRYLTWPVTIIACVFLGVLVWKAATSGRSTSSEVWSKLETAKTADDRVTLAKENPKSPAATWALLQAATEFFNLALSDLPNNRDVALPTSKKALDLFEKVLQEAPHDSPQARAAAMGKARVLEMRSRAPEDLAKAIEQYERVATDWPGTPEADDAKHFAEALKDPQAAPFYKDLYAYSPTKVTLPAFGTETLPPSFPGPLSPSEMPAAKNAPFGPLNPTPNPNSSTPAPSAGTKLPADMLPPALPEIRIEPKTTTPKVESSSKTKDVPSPKMEPPTTKVAEPPAKPKMEPPATKVAEPKAEAAKPAPTALSPAKPKMEPPAIKVAEPKAEAVTPKPAEPPAKPKMEPAKPAPTPPSSPAKPKMEPPPIKVAEPPAKPKMEPATKVAEPKTEAAKPASTPPSPAKPKMEPAKPKPAEPPAKPKAESATPKPAEPPAKPKMEPAASKTAEPSAKPKAEPTKPQPEPAKPKPAEPKMEPSQPKAEPTKPAPTPPSSAKPKAEPTKPQAEPAKPKAEPAKSDSTQKDLPADVFESKAEVPKEKAPQ